MRAMKIFRKRNSNCTTVQLLNFLVIFAYDRMIGLRIEIEGEQRDYFCDFDYREKQSAEHEINAKPYIRVTEKELNDMFIHALRNRLGTV